MGATRRQFSRWILSGAAARFLPACSRRRGAVAAPIQANARLGINFAGPVYYNSELPFVDLFRMSRDWDLQIEGSAPKTSPAPPALDENGWVTQVPSGTWAQTPLAVLGHVPEGVWTVLYDGVGKLEIWERVEAVREAPGRIRFRVTDPSKQIWLRIWRTDPSNYVRNIRVLMPGFENTYAANPWNPTFLQRWHGMAALRFMDLMQTNDSRIARWSERPRPEHATFAGRGVALELLIDLANRLRADPWFCIPHLADDDYVQNFAAMVKERLDPELKVNVEYSNELWNPMFQQHHHARQRGRDLHLARNDFEAALRYGALRALQIFRLWDRVFGDHSPRIVRVLASQAVNPWASSTILSVDGAAGNVNALAIAPYLRVAPSPDGKPSEAEASRWTLDDLFRVLDGELAAQRGWIREQNALARRNGLTLVAYEAGQHLAAIHGAENNDALTALFHEANRNPRMGDLYRRMYDAWRSEGGDLICHFSSVNPASKWGSWGLLEYHDSVPARSPKFVETMRWARTRGQDVSFAF